MSILLLKLLIILLISHSSPPQGFLDKSVQEAFRATKSNMKQYRQIAKGDHCMRHSQRAKLSGLQNEIGRSLQSTESEGHCKKSIGIKSNKAKSFAKAASRSPVSILILAAFTVATSS